MSKLNHSLMLLYSENGKYKLKDAAVMLKKSSQRLKYSLTNLIKEGTLYLPHALFDYSYFGLLMFRVYFKGGYVGEKDKAKIIKTLIENWQVVSVYELSGEFDLAIEIIAPNPSRFGKELKQIIFNLPTLRDYEIVLNQVSYIYPKFYLLEQKEITAEIPKEMIIGGDRKVETFEPRELLLMKIILEKPLIRRTTLAKEAGLNVKTTVKIIENLKSKKIYRGVKYLLDTYHLNYHRVRLFLKLHSTTLDREEELLSYFKNTKEIISLNKTIGDWDMEIDIESPQRSRAREIIIEIRETFKDLIYYFNSIDFYCYYKKAYLPSSYFLQEKKENNQF